MKKSNFAAPVLCSLLWTLPGMVALAPAARAQEELPVPATALVTAVRGADIVLSIGTQTGARVGAIYQIKRDGGIVQLQITQTRAAESLARVVGAATGGQSLLITVGDSAGFVGLAEAAPDPPETPATQPLPPQPPAIAPPDDATSAPPAQVLVTAINGPNVTLGAGSNASMKLGAVYALPPTGAIRARFIVVEVTGNSARARLLNVDEGFVPVVGSDARFVGIEPIPASALTPQTPIETPVVIVPTQPTVVAGAQLIGAPNGALSGSTATVTAVEGETVTLNAGSNQGASVGRNLPILRGGAVVGLVRITNVGADTSTATLVYFDAAQGTILVGDAAGLLVAQAPVTLPALGTPNQPIPAVTVKFESGASNVVVPKTYNTYELLASLAARGLIQSQPARVFQDDGARRHDVAEDITFSRAQVAGFISEAIGNFDGEAGQNSAALSILVKDYRRDLLDLKVPASTLAPFTETGFQLGVSSWTRLTAVGGDTGDNARDAFDERFGAKRRKTGFDTRTNIFGTITPKLGFYASFDAGTDIRNGEPFGQTASSSFRKAYVSYDAGSLLRGLTLKLGRQEYWWGPGHFGTGLLSDAAGGLDSLSSSFRRGSYELRGIYARLGRGPAGSPRSLYAQDANVRIGKSAKIGINTAILSPNDSFELKNFVTAFTPFPLYVIDREKGGASATNAVVSAYGEVAVARGVRLYGELILDDLGVNQNNPIENRDGSIFGFKLNDPKDPARAGFNFEYGRFNSVAYTYFANRTTFDADYYYYYRGAPLGYSIAPIAPTLFGGAENIRFDGYYRPLPKLTLFGSLQYADLNAEDQNPPGPRGFSRQRVFRFAATYDLTRRFALTARYQGVETDNPDFIKGSGTRKDSIFSLELGRSF